MPDTTRIPSGERRRRSMTGRGYSFTCKTNNYPITTSFPPNNSLHTTARIILGQRMHLQHNKRQGLATQRSTTQGPNRHRRSRREPQSHPCGPTQDTTIHQRNEPSTLLQTVPMFTILTRLATPMRRQLPLRPLQTSTHSQGQLRHSHQRQQTLANIQPIPNRRKATKPSY